MFVTWHEKNILLINLKVIDTTVCSYYLGTTYILVAKYTYLSGFFRVCFYIGYLFFILKIQELRSIGVCNGLVTKQWKLSAPAHNANTKLQVIFFATQHESSLYAWLPMLLVVGRLQTSLSFPAQTNIDKIKIILATLGVENTVNLI